MKINNTKLIVIFLLISFNILLVIKNKKYKKIIYAENAAIYNYSKSYNRDFELCSQNIVINFDSVFEKQIASSILVYVYTEDECSNCIFNDISQLKLRVREFNKDKIMILPVLKDTKRVKIQLQSELKGLNYKRINNNFIDIPKFKGIRSRFFAIIDSCGNILLPFFPNKTIPERTDAYLDFVFNKYIDINKENSIIY